MTDERHDTDDERHDEEQRRQGLEQAFQGQEQARQGKEQLRQGLEQERQGLEQARQAAARRERSDAQKEGDREARREEARRERRHIPIRLAAGAVAVAAAGLALAVGITVFYTPPPAWVERSAPYFLGPDGIETDRYRAGENMTIVRDVCVNVVAPFTVVRRSLRPIAGGPVIALNSGPAVRSLTAGCKSEPVVVPIPLDTTPQTYSYETEVDVPTLCIGSGTWCFRVQRIELRALPLEIFPNELAGRLNNMDVQDIRILSRLKTLEADLRALRLALKIEQARGEILRDRIAETDRKLAEIEKRPWYRR